MKQQSLRVVPGFGLSMGISIAMLSIFVLIPLLSIVAYSLHLTPAAMWVLLSKPAVRYAFATTIVCALVAAIINAIFGTILAWVLVRYDFYGKKLCNGLIELPFALPTAVAGITLSQLYGESGAIGSVLAKVGISVTYTKLGIIVALVFVGLPFVVRSIQPVLEGLDEQYEEAAAVFGTSGFRFFKSIIFPEIYPSILAGFGLAFARGLGEYGSVIYIAGNSYKAHTQVLSYLIMEKLERIDYASATTMALVMLILAFCTLFLINVVHMYQAKRAK